MVLMIAKLYGTLIGLLGVLGLFVGSGHLFKLMNADLALDLTRLALAALLCYAVYAKNQMLARNGLMLVGVLYLGMAVAGIFDAELWGILPNGLTAFDIIFHVVTGVFALGVARKPAAEPTK